eukprot:CAMPEP_0117508858 /NCGR_PEP_ID=MMETSP0784-20121206/27170_1 /TAXON_ID=39447 /ORGANISM="" /LENGTH=177 /DNA_ID=CAMNT_0005304435 /DNA_START=247 /DNA_END=783 /DNA_ORIENTATION=-
MNSCRCDRQQAYKSYVYWNVTYAILSVPILIVDAACQFDEWMGGLTFKFWNVFRFNKWLTAQYSDSKSVFAGIAINFILSFLFAHGGWYCAEKCRWRCKCLILFAWSVVYVDWSLTLRYHTPLSFGRLFCAAWMAITSFRLCCGGWDEPVSSYEPLNAEPEALSVELGAIDDDTAKS